MVRLLRWTAVPTFLTNIRRERAREQEKEDEGMGGKESENVGLE